MTTEEFVKASTNNLPSVDMFMVMDFIKNDERFNSAEIRGAKAAMASREEYGDSAVGYVELKREGPLCIMQCKICPEHRVRTKNYVVCLKVDEVNESVVSVECKDCAAAAGKKFEDLNDRITVGNCKKPPCRLRKNTVVDFRMRFTPDEEVTELKNTVYAVIAGIPFPFVGTDGISACDQVFKADGKTKASCPLKAGEEYVYVNKIEVLQIYPRVKVVVHWGLTGKNGDVICFEIPARITN